MIYRPIDENLLSGEHGANILLNETADFIDDPSLSADQVGEDYAEMGRTTLGPLVARYLHHRIKTGTLSVATARNHRSTLSRLASIHGNRPLHHFGRASVQAWTETLGDMRPSSRRAEISQVRGFLGWLADERIVTHKLADELPKIKAPRSVPRALDGDLVEKLMRTVPDVRGEAIVMLMFGSGLRCIEVSRLNVEDWSRRDELLLVTGKGGHQREVPVPTGGPVYRALTDYLSRFPATSGPMIRSYARPTHALARGTLSEMVANWLKEAGVKTAARDGVSAHALRHTAASDLLDASGNDLRVVQEFLGHAHLQTTSIYLRRAGTAKIRDAMMTRWKATGAMSVLMFDLASLTNGLF